MTNKKWYGSVHNRLMESVNPIKVEVGMGITKLQWSDRSAYTIVKIVNDKKIIVQRDEVKRIDKNGMSDCQEYEYIQNTKAPLVEVHLLRDGRWHFGTRLSTLIGIVNVRDEYYDYSF